MTAEVLIFSVYVSPCKSGVDDDDDDDSEQSVVPRGYTDIFVLFLVRQKLC